MSAVYESLLDSCNVTKLLVRWTLCPWSDVPVPIYPYPYRTPKHELDSSSFYGPALRCTACLCKHTRKFRSFVSARLTVCFKMVSFHGTRRARGTSLLTDTGTYARLLTLRARITDHGHDSSKILRYILCIYSIWKYQTFKYIRIRGKIFFILIYEIILLSLTCYLI